MNRAEELAEDHWNDYVLPLLEAHMVTAVEIQVSRFHYKSAFVHGYKHAMQDAEATPLDPKYNGCFEGDKRGPSIHKNIESMISEAHAAFDADEREWSKDDV